MATTKISAFVPQTKELRSVDPKGGVWVKVKPPGWEEESFRGRMLSKRSYRYDELGRLVTEVDCNVRELWAFEIWLTYAETNLDVTIEHGDGKEEQVTFPPREETNFNEFADLLGKLPPPMVYDWRDQVMAVVPAWRDPF
jgi:hypothetical protein